MSGSRQKLQLCGEEGHGSLSLPLPRPLLFRVRTQSKRPSFRRLPTDLFFSLPSFRDSKGVTFMDRAELTTEQVLKRDIPWEIYMSSKLITGTGLQLLRRYDKRTESQKASLLDDVSLGWTSYVRTFVSILRDISKEEAVEYVLALIDEMLTANPKRARLFHDKSLSGDDIYEPFLS
uniref:V-type proton ATPase subunit H n=1 Tax=Ananas comosus var. bracteatus TaxID=296719 RepID=A0A6V7NFE4_ANACO|nr:unnamed protein product [Ananas comosus var. bracteatus]